MTDESKPPRRFVLIFLAASLLYALVRYLFFAENAEEAAGVWTGLVDRLAFRRLAEWGAPAWRYDAPAFGNPLLTSAMALAANRSVEYAQENATRRSRLLPE